MVKIFNHPLISHKLCRLRNKNTSSKEFKELINEIATLMIFDVTKDFETKEVEVETPMQTMKHDVCATKVVLAPILRAGVGMLPAFEQVLPSSSVAVLGMYRDEETLEIHPYFEKYPKHIENSEVLILDPMLATGASAVAAIEMLKRRGAKNIKFVGIIGVDQGINHMQTIHPDVDIFLAVKDEKLNENAYILPGLGDAGDRIFNTND